MVSLFRYRREYGDSMNFRITRDIGGVFGSSQLREDPGSGSCACQVAPKGAPMGPLILMMESPCSGILPNIHCISAFEFYYNNSRQPR